MASDDRKTREQQEAIAEQARNMVASRESDHRLQKAINRRHVDAQLAAKEQVQKLRDEDRHYKVAKGEYWKNVEKGVAKFTRLDEEAGQASYTQWQTNLMSILGAVNVTCTALYHDDIHKRFLEFMFSPASNYLIKPYLYQRATSETQLEKTIPKINYTIAVNEKGELTTEIYQDAIPLPKEQQQLFDIGAVAWLNEQGYDFVPDPLDPDTYVLISRADRTKRLTPELLETLEFNNEQGFGAFLHTHLNIDATPQPDVTSRFSPS